MWINKNLYRILSGIANPCTTNAWLGKTTPIIKGSVGSIEKAEIKLRGIKNLLDYYILKIQPVSNTSSSEVEIMKLLSIKMLKKEIPNVFCFLYLYFTHCEKVYLLMHPFNITLSQAIKKIGKPSVGWWVSILYQLSNAIMYLEELEINHNDITLDNVMLHKFTSDPKLLQLVVIDFGSAVLKKSEKVGLPDFVLGRDLNYVLYILINDGIEKGYFPQELKAMEELLEWNTDGYKHSTDYSTGLCMSNLTKNNPKTSGKNVRGWLAQKYTFLDSNKRAKILGAGIGSVIGDALGMPVQNDYSGYSITDYHSSDEFSGSLSHLNLKPKTFTDETELNLLFIKSIDTTTKEFQLDTFMKLLKEWDPIDITRYMNAFIKTGNRNPTVADASCLSSSWITAVLPGDPIKNAIKQAGITHENSDSIAACIYVTCLIQELINGCTLQESKTIAFKHSKKYATKELLSVLVNSGGMEYRKLNGGTGNVIDTMSVVLWCISNTNNFKDAVLKSVNVPGVTDTNGSIVGSIAGALYGIKGIPSELLIENELIEQFCRNMR